MSENYQEDIINKMSILYELSLASGQSLNLEKNCNLFLTKLLKRKNLTFGGLWIKNEYLDNNNYYGMKLVYAKPSFFTSKELCYDLFDILEDKSYRKITSEDEEFSKIRDNRVKKGSYAIFKIKDFAVLKLYSEFEDKKVFSNYEMKQLLNVLSKFGTSIKACLSYSELQNKFKAITNSVKDAIVMFSKNGKISFWNPAAERILGYKQENMIGENFLEKVIPEKNINKLEKVLSSMEKDRSESNNSGKDIELKGLKSNKSKIDILLSLSFVNLKNKEYIIAIIRDITERKRKEEKIKYLLYHDNLTGLYNHRFFEQELKRLDTERQLPISLIMIDVNGLKLANDTFGHEEGDKIIKNAARLLQESCRQEDICGRWGGDEFLLILPQTQKKAASKIIKRIKDNADKYESNLPVSIAFGFSTKNENGQDINEILQRADENMYENKLKESQKNKNRLMEMLFDKLEKNKFVTKKHCQRVSLLAESLGKEIDLTQTQLDKLKLTAKFHDIGYLTLSDKVNSKKEMLKKHVKIGYRIARASKEYAHIGMGILHHHENWDGTGYPDQQKEKEIPLDSRIIALVDFYDRLTETQTQSNSKENIIKVIKSESGKKFDPELVSVFIKCCIMKMRNR
ncbi:MAG: diguanylate cyclase [Candidatus Woesearchaeota archaeon]